VANVALGPYGDPLVHDVRLERVFYQLQRLVKFDDFIEFATQLQEPVEGEGGGSQGAIAVFMVISPHPRKNKLALSPHQLISVAQMPYENWVEADKEFRHYANLTDPLRPIFAGLLRQHLQKREALQELN